MDPNPQQVIDKLRKENAKLKCLNKLRRQRQKELQRQLDWVYRQSMAIVKNIHGQK